MTSFVNSVCRTLIFKKTNTFSIKWLIQKATVTTGAKGVNSSFLLNIFKGRIDKSEIWPFPEVMKEEQIDSAKKIIGDLKTLLTKKNNYASLYDLQMKIPNELLEALWKMGVFAIQVPKEFGGLGLSRTQYVKIISILGKYDIGLAIVLAEHQGRGFRGISLYGTPAQKKKYLTRVTRGEFAAMCWQEQESGSDVTSMKTKAILSSDKKHFILNGTKSWVSNGGIASIFVVLTKIENLEQKSIKLSALIVDKSFDGISISETSKKNGISVLSVADVAFKDVKVPVENLLGNIGEGYKMGRTIIYGGTISIPSIMLGVMRNTINSVIKHTKECKRFDHKVSEFSSVRKMLTRMMMYHYVSQALTYLLAGNVDEGSAHLGVESMACKCFTTEAAWNACDEALQILGRDGYSAEYGLDLIMSDLRIFRIYAGINEVLKVLITLDGIRYITAKKGEEEKAVGNALGRSNVDPYITSIENIQDNFNTKELLEMAHPELQNVTRSLIEAVEKFALAVEKLVNKYNKLILGEFTVLQELANIAILIYACVASLSRTSRALYLKSGTSILEKEITECFCEEACLKIHSKLKYVLSPNFQSDLRKLEALAREAYRVKRVPYESPIGI